jgi:hypothetical protein|uniref:DUF3311 domain-containing protein n=1 Tax=Desulfobacca acetoxidans TaxID=60893 RepID=A0A7C5AKZ5_9BACT
MSRRDKFWALWGILFFFLLNYPFLQMANQEILVGGLPLLVLYLHLVWLGAIFILYVLGRHPLSRE